jgi:glutaredoxin 2
MKLFVFEHCSLCFRVRMMAAKRRHLQETVLLDDISAPHSTPARGKARRRKRKG